jgi:hypothetical protein
VDLDAKRRGDFLCTGKSVAVAEFVFPKLNLEIDVGLMWLAE